MKVEKIVYKNADDCYRITGGGKELVITAGFGPRILFFGFSGGPNALYCPEDMAPHNDGLFHGYGGHRFWIAPESLFTYHPDNVPCEVSIESGRFCIHCLDEVMGIRKTIVITMEGNDFVIDHQLINESGHLYNGAPWAITCVPPEGMVFMPWYASEEWKASKIIYWQKWLGHSTNINSKQYKMSPDFFLIFPNGEEGKVGTSGEQGFIGVSRGGQTFIKQFDHQGASNYPDDNCAIQSYQNSDLVELETLGPLVNLIPGRLYTHRERWRLFPRAIGEGELGEIRSMVNSGMC